MKKTGIFYTLMLAIGLFAIMAMASCSKVRHKMAEFMNGSVEDYSIENLYPELENRECVGARRNGLLYDYWFRYKATPAEVEDALIAKSCHFTEIVPDSALQPCDRVHVEKEFGSLQQAYFGAFVEWTNAPEEHLLYRRCTRTPLEHIIVFDTVSGYVYHHISEFRE